MEYRRMAFSKARYVTVCQQLLVTGAVLLLGISAAGVRTLDIVAPDAHTPGFTPACGSVPSTGAAARSHARTPGGRPTGCGPAGAPAPATRR
jgi:hypothetical protein